jgi:hypothetical protein
LAQIDLINLRWKVPDPVQTGIQVHLTAWVTEDTEPLAELIATNLDYTAALQAQTQIGSGHFFKGFCTSEIQKIINTQRDGPLNAFKQLRWTSNIVQCVLVLELEHWKLRNSDKHGHTIQETDTIKREQLLATTCELLQTQHNLPPRYRKMLPAYSKLTKKHTKNLKTWINTTQQTIHYLLNVRNQADDDPNDDTRPDAIALCTNPQQMDCPHHLVVKQAKSH